MSLHANNPVKNAAIKPTDNSPILIEDVIKSSLTMSLAIFPNINGTTIKKENLAALERSTPNKTDVAIVAPDLEIPGRIAIA